MALITDFCTAHAISDVPERTPSPAVTVTESVSKEKRHVQVARLYHDGMSVRNIAEKFHVKQITIIHHLYRYFQDGNRIESGHIIDDCAVPSDVQEKVCQAFDTHGYQFLKPVFEAMDREIPYDDLHLLRIHYLYANHIEPPSKMDDGMNADPCQQETDPTE
jgi:ATP-dependent DNA helicase RecQ